MERWFLDTEFNDDGKTIELISIALVCEDGREYYAHSSEYDVGACNDWVKENVLPKLALVRQKKRSVIAAEILQLVGQDPEFWAYFADYDWVALCQLYGPMIALPYGWPMFCMDLKQLMVHRGVTKDQLPPQSNEHDALDDARWALRAFNYLATQAQYKPGVA